MNSKISIMISVMLAVLVESMDATIMNTSMPVIAEELGGFNMFSWPFASYMITTTILAIIAGRLSDMFGRKKVFSFGIILFLIGSLLCGLSQSMVQLVIFRGIQGIGGGFMLPFPAIIAGDLFSIEHRGKIQALGTTMWGLSAVIAPMFGAFFVEYLTWRWIFFVNIPITLLILLALIPYHDEYTPKKASIDYVGAFLFIIGISLFLLITVVDANQIVFFVVGVLFLVGFYYFEMRQLSPLIPFSLFTNKKIRLIHINGFIGWAALFGTATYIPLFLQKIAHLTIFISGLALLGTAIGWISASVPSGKWILKYGYRPLFILGNSLLVISGILLVFLQEGTSFLYVFLTMVIQGFAFGLLSTTGVIGSQQLVQAHDKGVSTSFMLFTRNMGTAVGVTIMGLFLSSSDGFMAGINHLFFYGLIGGFLALLTAFLIKDEEPVNALNH